MKRIMITSFLALVLSGCAIGTQGEASWELTLGFHTKQISDKPAKISVESTEVSKVVDFFTSIDSNKEP